MNMNSLDFEQSIAELDVRIEELRHLGNDSSVDVVAELSALQKQQQDEIKRVFKKLTAWQVVQLSRHPLRPHTRDYIEKLFTDFDELHGDRMYADDEAIMGGLADFDGTPVMVIGQEKGRTTKEKIRHNFGLPRPEGYRKALRLMKMAEHFQLPVITFIDTQGAFPGIDAEERGQSEAIARNLFEMSKLTTPVICVVIGEGGSGGALAIGVGDRVLMLEYSMYSVITPEGCASILWRTAERAPEAAESLKLRAKNALELGLIDEVVAEPAGGAHRDAEAMCETLREAISRNLNELKIMKTEQLLQKRYQRLMQYGMQ